MVDNLKSVNLEDRKPPDVEFEALCCRIVSAEGRSGVEARGTFTGQGPPRSPCRWLMRRHI